MEKMRMESEDIQQDNVARIGALFPNCVTETRGEDGKLRKAINFDLLRQMLSDTVTEGDEAYEFTWVGKKASIVEANKPIRKTLRPCREESVNWDTTENLYIEGDNLEVLKLLQESYLGKVKMIYIDPPYNTGSDFIYNDDFKMSSAEYADESGEVDEEGNRMFKNTDSNGRFHSDWCSMIYSRLMLARNLLSEDGVIFISIDDNEQANLKKMCDEIFGADNFVATLVWAAGRKNDSKYISVSHEYMLCYVQSLSTLIANHVLWRERKQGIDDIYSEYSKLKKQYRSDYKGATQALKAWYKGLPDTNPAKNHSHYSCIDERGIYFPSDISWPGGGGPKYEVLHPVTHKPVKIPNRGWVYPTKERMDEVIKQGLVHFGEDENSVPCKKTYLAESELTTPYSVFYQDGRASTKRLRNLMGAMVFQNPKDEEIIKSLIEFTLSNNDSIILDFFSGSATTAHAVMQLNAEDGGSRKFIMVQLPEETDEKSEAFKAGYKNICEIGKERIRRAAKKIHEDKTDATFDDGFRVLKLDDSNMNGVYYAAGDYTQDLVSTLESNVKSDRTDLDLLFGCLLEWGLPLSLPYTSETIEGCTVHTYNDGDLIACFDENVPESVIKTIAKRRPLRAVFRDSSFASSPEKINVGEIFKSLAPDTRVKVI